MRVVFFDEFVRGERSAEPPNSAFTKTGPRLANGFYTPYEPAIHSINQDCSSGGLHSFLSGEKTLFDCQQLFRQESSFETFTLLMLKTHRSHSSTSNEKEFILLIYMHLVFILID